MSEIPIFPFYTDFNDLINFLPFEEKLLRRGGVERKLKPNID